MASPSSFNFLAPYRPVLYGAMLSAILTGINISGTYAYVSSNYDSRIFKGIVVLLLLIDLSESLVIALSLDYNLIGSFNDPITLTSLPRYYFLENLGSVIVTLVSQSYVAWTIYMVNGRWWPLCVLICPGGTR
ncbi:hypothetical protein K439DRAFT_535075 [Ramaria rubella]|nr:hypothetical protein K439DRAFT_535075 [Ramaria rubella]